jgi:hypothetical protein
VGVFDEQPMPEILAMPMRRHRKLEARLDDRRR